MLFGLELTASLIALAVPLWLQPWRLPALLTLGWLLTVLVLALVGRWLMAWGDAFLTGMFAAIFVAFAPQWLATWSDQRYLHRP